MRISDWSSDVCSSDLGARVVVAGRDEAALAELAEEIGGLAVRCDITDEGDLAALADAAVARFGHLDIALNATGWGLLKPFLETKIGSASCRERVGQYV